MIPRWAARAPKVARILILAVVLVASAVVVRAEEPVYPPPSGYVVDAAGLLSDDTKTHVTAIAQELDEKTGVQIAVAVVPSIAPIDIDEYAVTLFKKWGVGSKSKDEGVLFVVAQKERRVRFEVGYGLESLLPDGRMGGILRSAVVPHLKQDDWDGGVEAGIEAVASIVAQDKGVKLASLAGATPAPEDDDTSHGKLPPTMVLLIAFIVIAVISNAIAQANNPNRRRNRWGGWGGYGGFGGGFGGFGGGSSGGGGGFGGFGGGSSGGGGASSGF